MYNLKEKLGDDMKQVTIEKLDHQGRGIAREEKPFFIQNSLPGEIVEIKVIDEKKKFGVGKVGRWIKTSEKRIKPVCPYFEKCGGCDLMHLDYKNQVDYKRQKVIEIMDKFAGLDETKIDTIITCENPLYYRNKVTFQIDNCVGFYEKKASFVIPIDHCYIVSPKINKVLENLKEIPLKNIKQIVVKTDQSIEEVMVVLDTIGTINTDEVISKLKSCATTIIQKINGKEKVLYGNSFIVMPLDDYTFEISADAFFQVNLNQCQKLYQEVVKLAAVTKEDTVLDLYCGTGTIGIYISKYAKEVYGVELNSDAIKNANKNKERNHANNISFTCGDCGEVVRKLLVKPNIVIVDPPRKGLDCHTIDKLLTWDLKTIVYVSCDPVTLARDLKLLEEKYEVKKIIPVDMFPQTYHVECIALISAKK